MPPTGGYRTSLSWQARYGPLGQAVTDAVFSPGQPLAPPDQEPVRVWDFPAGVNAVITPRAGHRAPLTTCRLSRASRCRA